MTEPAPAPVIRLAEVDSTNAYCQREAAALPCPCVVLADRQTAGRGRQGRSWLSPGGENLYLSILVPLAGRESCLGALPMVAAVAGLDALRQVGLNDAWIKWPNDLLVDDRKLMGVLIETTSVKGRGELAIVGIGINLDLSAEELARIDRPATSVAAELGEPVERGVVLAPLLTSFFAHWQVLPEGQAALAQRWSATSRLTGREITVDLPTESLSGTVTGFATDGALLLRLADGSTRPIQAGDVHLRRD
jgi:BirA family biotin operon repressor/biotin-[acetyl-CoA-carboxylase] ligase